jgi:hypothetical protein
MRQNHLFHERHNSRMASGDLTLTRGSPKHGGASRPEEYRLRTT